MNTVFGRTGRAWRWLFLLPALIALAVTAIYPLGFAAVTSLLNWRLTRPDLGISFAGWANFSAAFSSTGGMFVPSLVRTVVFVVITVGVELALGLGLALLLNRSFRFRALLIAVLSTPMMLTPVAVAYMWRYMYDADGGVINAGLAALGAGQPVWLQSTDPPWLTFAAVIAVDVWQWTPFMMLLCVAGLASVSDEVIEAARLDGASTAQIARRILIPLIRPTLVVAALLRGIGAFKEFDKIFIMTGGGPGSSTELVSYRIFVQGLREFDFGQTGVSGLVLSGLTIVLAAVFLAISRRSRT